MSASILINRSVVADVHNQTGERNDGGASTTAPLAPLFRPFGAMPSSNPCRSSTVSPLSSSCSSASASSSACSSSSSSKSLKSKTPYFVVPESASTNSIMVVEEPHPLMSYDGQAIEQFYNEAYQLHVPLETVHAACMDAERWAKKWLACSNSNNQDSEDLFGWNSMTNNKNSSSCSYTSQSICSNSSSIRATEHPCSMSPTSAIEAVFTDPRDSSNGCAAPVFVLEEDEKANFNSSHNFSGEKHSHTFAPEDGYTHRAAKAARQETSTTTTVARTIIHRPTPLRVLRPTLPAGVSLQEFMSTNASTVLNQYQDNAAHVEDAAKEDSTKSTTTNTRGFGSSSARRSISVSPITVSEYIPEEDSDEEEEESKDVKSNELCEKEQATTTTTVTFTEHNTETTTVVHVIEPEDEEQQDRCLVVRRPVARRILCTGNNHFVIAPEASPKTHYYSKWTMDQAKRNLYKALANNGGEPSGSLFESSLNILKAQFHESGKSSSSFEDTNNLYLQGLWLTLTKPNYFGCLGYLEGAGGDKVTGDPLYTLGRMSFDLFRPKDLICSLQGNFNTIRVCSPEERLSLLQTENLPACFQQQVKGDDCVLKTYNIIAAFTIEPASAVTAAVANAAASSCSNKMKKQLEHQLQEQPPVAVRGIMVTCGYTLPDPSNPNRSSVWITGGRIAPNDTPQDIAAWKEQFSFHSPVEETKREQEKSAAKRLACELLIGVQVDSELNPEDGSLEYTFRKPLGGHGVAFVDTLYMDDNLRVVRGHRGTIFVTKRLSSSSLS